MFNSYLETKTYEKIENSNVNRFRKKELCVYLEEIFRLIIPR